MFQFCRVLVFVFLALTATGQAFADDSIASLEKKAELAPSDQNIQFNLGIQYSKAGDIEKAAQAFQRCVKLDPQDADAWLLLGKVLSKQQKWQDAKAAFDKALAFKSKNPGKDAELLKNFEAQANLGMALSKLGKTPEAIKAFENATKLRNNNSKIFLNLGILYLKASQLDKAQSALEKAAQLDPSDPAPQGYLCEIFNSQGNFQKAQAACQKALTLNPKQAKAFYGLGFAQYQLKDLVHARENFEQAVKLDPNQATAYYNLGFLDYESGNLDAALANFHKALEARNGDYPEARYNLAVVEGDQGRWEEAAQEYRSLLARDASNQDAKNNLAYVIETGTEALLKQGSDAYLADHWEQAAEAWKKVLKLNPDNATAKEFLEKVDAKLKQAQKKQKQVLEAQAAQKMAQEDNKILVKGMAALNAGKYDAAVSQLSFFVKNHPDRADAKKALFQAKSRLRHQVEDLTLAASKDIETGKRDQAKSKLNKALDLDPNNAPANTLLKNMTGSVSKQKASAEDIKKMYFQGVNLYLDGKIDEALKIWKALLKEDPSHLDAQRSVARAQAELAALHNLKK